MPKLRQPPLREEPLDTAQPDGTGVWRDERGRVTAGGPSLNPRGRTPGSRDKISQAFLRDLQALWEEEGPAILKRLAKKDPRAIVAACVALVPKGVEVDAKRVGWGP
jgi:hypothetical protein